MDLAIAILKFIMLAFALLLTPVVVIAATPFVLLWPRRSGVSWGDAVKSRYWRVAKTAWKIADMIGWAVP
jgi:hypothetical protein